MSYEPTVWKTGDVVTSAKLNKLEQGVAGGGSGGGALLLHEDENGTLDKTYAEIAEAAQTSVVMVFTLINEGEEGLYEISYLSVYGIDQERNKFVISLGGRTYLTESENGYPSYSSGEDDESSSGEDNDS